MSLATKYRPKKWEEVVEQESVVRVLSKQLETRQFKNAYIFSGTSGCGKAQPLYENVLTPRGFVKMGTIKVGDEVINGKGETTRVLGVYPQGKRDCFRITFSDRTYIDVADNHLNSVWWQMNGIRYDAVLTTEELISKVNEFKGSRKVHVDMPVMKCWSDKGVDINPYLMGALLGDGSMSKTNFGFTNAESDVVDKISHILEEDYGLVLKETPGDNYDYRICFKNKWKYKFSYKEEIYYDCTAMRDRLVEDGYPKFDCGTILRISENNAKTTLKRYPELVGAIKLIECNNLNGRDGNNILRQKFIDLGLNVKSIDKHIPKEYLMSSVNTRLELLRGLMDTDGHKGGRTFSTSSKRLADDFEFLVRSLGIKCTRTEKTPSYNGKVYHTHYTFYLKPSRSMSIVSSKKMLESVTPPQREPDRTITDIISIGKVNCQCIYVESDDHTYITSNFTVTHNTTNARIFANEINNGLGKPIEIDAASNSGVENMRTIIKSASERALDSEYKIIIVDECHSLSNQAWQSLLKIIEETPKYTIFIFCTTNPEKIPATIVNRCQRFNFTRISVDGIRRRLNFILANENCGELMGDRAEVTDYIARISKGEMRNAITMLETIIDAGSVDIDTCVKVLGSFDYLTYIDLTDAMLNGDLSLVSKIINKIYNDGTGMHTFVSTYLAFLLDVLKYCYSRDIGVTKIPVNIQNEIDTLIDFNDSAKYYQYYIDKVLELKTTIRNDDDPITIIQIYFDRMGRLV